MSRAEMTIEELVAQVEPLLGYVGRKMQHVRSSGWYRITGVHFVESDMSVVFSYETLHRRPVSFVRPVAEVLDGRFTIGSAA